MFENVRKKSHSILREKRQNFIKNAENGPLLPERSFLKGQKLVENAKIRKNATF